MAVVYTEVIHGQTGGKSASGYRATRTWKVTGISAGTSMVKAIDDAIDNSDLPDFGDTHPDSGGSPADIGDILVEDISGSWIDDENTMAEIVVTYSRPSFETQEPSENPDEAIIQVGSTVSTIRTNKDASDTDIVISLTGEEDQLAEVDVEVPQTVLMFQRRESTNPITKSLTYSGKVNSGSLGGGTYAAGTLLCLGIEGDSSDNGLTWTITYRFQYDPAGWNGQTVVYIDPDTDRPHADVDLSTGSAGWESVDMYDTANFSNLTLSF